MNINTNNLVSITEANQNFSKEARLVDESGAVAILKITFHATLSAGSDIRQTGDSSHSVGELSAQAFILSF